MILDKIKKIFQEKDEKKKMDNLVSFLIILIVTLIIINKILKNDSKSDAGSYQNQTGIELVNNKEENTVLVNSGFKDDIEERLENILSKINGVRKC